MRALLVHARSPVTYWSYEFALPYAGKRAALAPLGLATVAAQLPAGWELRLVDLQVEPLRDEDLAWADAVLVSGMLVQAGSMRAVLDRARRHGKRTVVGGPAATATPEAFPEADHVFLGEAEGRLDRLVAALESPGVPAPRVLSPDDGGRPALEGAPVPRFDLLKLDRYASLSVQVSRGCPFRCEFCDIIEMYGRIPRLKSPDQVVAELEALRRLGGRGPLFVVDDNFIGNRRAVARLLPRVAAWQREHGRPFDLYTEASLDLAAHPDLVAAMAGAGFTAVFVGLESPSAASLQATGKTQNLRIDPVEAVDLLTRSGFEVFAGFIVGFDSDDTDIFDQQLELISRLPVPRAMVGLLGAAPGTALWRRLDREGRLRRDSTGDQFGRPNFEPAMDERTLVAGYRRLLASLYDAEAFYARAGLVVDRIGDVPTPKGKGTAAALLRTVWGIGVRGPRRRHFWRLAARAARRGPSVLARGLALAALGEHMIRYTEEVVLPRLDETLSAIDAGRAHASAPPRAATG
jgi:radical SAM superfamily enzyme YgiQ (UPF0313 family)